MNACTNPKDCLSLTLSTLCAAGEATHLGAAGQHNLQAARGNRGEYQTKPNQNMFSAGIFEQSLGAGNRVEIGLSYRPARIHRLAESIPWNPFLGS
jgi:hypothetical protein